MRGPVLERCERQIEPEPNSGCWLWTGIKNNMGYGYASVGHSGKVLAHRVMYASRYGEIPRGGIVRHTCDLPACVNPDHLRLGTMKENTQDMLRRGRHRVVAVRGEAHRWAKLTAEQVMDIRARYRGSRLALSQEYGVSPSLISMVAHGRCWKHLPVNRPARRRRLRNVTVCEEGSGRDSFQGEG